MSDFSEHEHSSLTPTDIGIPRRNAFNPIAFEQAITDLLSACGIAPDTAHMGKTAQRVRDLWQKRLLGGYDLDPASALGDGFEDHRQDMVIIRGIAIPVSYTHLDVYKRQVNGLLSQPLSCAQAISSTQ